MDNPIIGSSRSTQNVKNLIKKVATSELNTVVQGETGVGKELVVQALYENSKRSGKPFQKINCAALPESLLESELFGYEKGAFTGAHNRLRGKFLQADKGVLFLDEIGDMPVMLQSKLLRVLQDGMFTPLGSEEIIKSDVWVISATNKDIKTKIESGEFRSDLFFRINIVNIQIDPLRKRPDDIPSLVDYYFDKYSAKFQKKQPLKLSDSLRARLCQYHWPGNVRELQNALKKLTVFGEQPDILADIFQLRNNETSDQKELPLSIFSKNRKDFSRDNYKLIRDADLSLKRIKSKTINRVDREVISYVLNQCGWNRVKASKHLEISYRSLLSRISELGLQSPDIL